MFRNRILSAALAAALLGSTALAPFAPAVAQEAVVTADKQSEDIVAAADAFIATLTAAQQDAAMFAFDDATRRANWSNFPVGIYQRAGVAWGELDETQRAALTTLLGTVLSPYGLSMVQEQMAADGVLASESGRGGGGGGGPGGGGGLTFGSDYYYVSFLGAPSTTEPWMLQFGGHHLAINATMVGPDVTFAPSLTGGQPTRLTIDGVEVYIVEDEVDQANALMASLSADQLSQVVRSSQSIDLVLGPGKDGMTLQPEGLLGADMTAEQKAQLIALIQSRLQILNDDDSAAAMADIEANIDQTSFAWFGATDDAGSAYWRVTGPTVILEFSPQSMGGDPGNHLHNMYRNPVNDYGSGWTSLQ